MLLLSVIGGITRSQRKVAGQELAFRLLDGDAELQVHVEPGAGGVILALDFASLEPAVVVFAERAPVVPLDQGAFVISKHFPVEAPDLFRQTLFDSIRIFLSGGIAYAVVGRLVP